MNGIAEEVKQVDLAKECGVSLRVVNTIMTGKTSSVRYSAKTKEKVLETAERLGYRPNRLARNLQTGCCGTIAILVGNFYDITERTMDALIETANKHSKMILLEKIGSDNPHPKSFSEKMSDGFIAIGQVSEQVAAEIDKTGSPCVFVNTNRRTEANCITFDEQGAMKLAVERFISNRRKHIAFICSGPTDHYYVEERIRGLETAIRRHGLAKLKILRNTYEMWEPELSDLIFEFLKTNPEIDAALLCMDHMAPAFYDAAEKNGKTVPADISVISVNNSLFSMTARPPTTSLGIDRFVVGMLAIEKLVSMLAGKKVSPTELKYELIPRDSA